MEGPIYKKLSWIISQYGVSIFESSRRCEALLKDYCYDCRKEIFVLISIVRSGMIPEILNISKENSSNEAQIAILTNRLCNDFGFAEEIAAWAIANWAIALGVIGEDKFKQVSSYEEKNCYKNIKIDRPEIQVYKDVFETTEEFEKRIRRASPAPGGIAKLIKEQYDIETGLFPVEVILDEWCKKLYPIIDCNFYFLADHIIAKKIYETCGEHTLYLNLLIRDDKVYVQSIDIHCLGKMRTIFREKVINSTSKDKAASKK